MKPSNNTPHSKYQFTLKFNPDVASLGGVRLSPLGTSATVGLLYQPRMIDDAYGAVGGMMIGRGNRSTRRKPAPVPLCPPQIPHDLGSTPGRRGGKPSTNRLCYGTAVASPYWNLLRHQLFRGLELVLHIKEI
jgi:hypothetical protein